KDRMRPSAYGDARKDGALWAADIDPDLGMIAIGGEARKVQLYNLVVRNRPNDPYRPPNPWLELKGPEGLIRQLRFGHGKPPVLASLSENDRDVWLWNVDRTAPRALQEEWIQWRPG